MRFSSEQWSRTTLRGWSPLLTRDQEGILTDRQHEVLETSYREGFFEVPRKCTLAELATTLDIDKATATEILRRAQENSHKWYFTGSDVDLRP